MVGTYGMRLAILFEPTTEARDFWFSRYYLSEIGLDAQSFRCGDGLERAVQFGREVTFDEYLLFHAGHHRPNGPIEQEL